MLQQTGEFLANSGGDLRLRPVLAESWKPNQDGTVWLANAPNSIDVVGPIIGNQIGGGNGKMKLGGQFIDMPERTPLANQHLTLLNKFGIEQDKFADSTGIISAL